MIDDLGMKKRCSVWIPYQLTENHKQQRREFRTAFIEMCERVGEDEILRRHISVAETYISFSLLAWRLETKVWCRGDEPRPRIVQFGRGQRTMAIIAVCGDSKFCVDQLGVMKQ